MAVSLLRVVGREPTTLAVVRPLTSAPDPTAEIAATCGMPGLALYSVLRHRADASGAVVGTLGDFAGAFGCSTRHVRDAAAALESHGFVTRETVRGPRGIAAGVRFCFSDKWRTYYPEPNPELSAEPTPEPLTYASAGRPVLESVRSNDRTSREEKNDDGLPNGNVAPSAPPAAKVPPVRSEKQAKADAVYERRMLTYHAWCRGIGLDPESDEAEIGKAIGLREIKTLEVGGLPTPPDIEACTRFMVAESWRDERPRLPAVVRSFPGWVADGRPAVPMPKVLAVSPNGVRRGGVSLDYRKQQIADLKARGE